MLQFQLDFSHLFVSLRCSSCAVDLLTSCIKSSSANCATGTALDLHLVVILFLQVEVSTVGTL